MAKLPDPNDPTSVYYVPSFSGGLNQAVNSAYSQMVTFAAPTTTPKPKRTKKAKFVVGDTVEVIGSTNHYHDLLIDYHDLPIGAKGVILGGRQYDSAYGYDVEVEGGHTQSVHEHDLKRFAPVRVTIDSVIIAEHKKEEIRAAIAQDKHKDLIFEKWGFGQVFEKGTAVSLLFYGVPGTGKTLMAQAIADDLNAQLQIITTAEIESSEPGQAERNLQSVFKKATQAHTSSRPHVILFDECDSLLTDRNELGPVLGAQVNCLLGEIERFTGVVIFTTNRLGKLDPALNRRITAKIEFAFPNRAARRLIWTRMVPDKAPLHTDVNFDALAAYHIAGGNIKNAVLNAARIAAYRGETTIKQEHFEESVKRELAGVSAFVEAYEQANHQTQVRRGVNMRTKMGVTVGGDNA